LKHHIEIEQIENGFILKLFDEDGKVELDKNVFVLTWNQAIETLEKWHKQELEDAKEESE